MTDSRFQIRNGQPVSAVTAAEMREVDRVAVEDVGVSLLQMTENAGRTLAQAVLEELDGESVAVLAGSGGNKDGVCTVPPATSIPCCLLSDWLLSGFTCLAVENGT